MRQIPKALAVVVILTACFLCDAVDCEAQTVPSFSHGPTIPFVLVELDSQGDAEASLLAAGAGYSLNWNLARTDDGRWSRFVLGFPQFVRFPEGGAFQYKAGVTVGTANGLLTFGVVWDLVDTQSDRGALLGKLSRAETDLVLAFGFNFGSGAEPQATSGRAKVANAGAGKPPTGYVSF